MQRSSPTQNRFDLIADRVEIDALRGEFSDAATMNDYDRYQRTPGGWRFSERVYELRYVDTTPLTGSPTGGQA